MMWPPCSPNLTPLDFFGWGFIKSDVCHVKRNSIQQLNQRIRAGAAKITPAMLGKVFRNVEKRWSLCLDVQGGHIEMHWKYVLLWYMFQNYYIMCNNTCLNTKYIVTFESPYIIKGTAHRTYFLAFNVKCSILRKIYFYNQWISVDW